MSDPTKDTMTGTEDLSKDRDQAALALKSKVIGEARHLGEDVKHLASDVAGQTKKRAESQLEEGKSSAASKLGGVANALRKTGEQLRAEDNDMFTEYLDAAAKRVDGAAGYLKTRSISDVVGDVEGFARREPALFLGGALMLGLLGGRFLKSTRPSPNASAPNAPNARSGGARAPERLSLDLEEDWRDTTPTSRASQSGSPNEGKNAGNERSAKSEGGASASSSAPKKAESNKPKDSPSNNGGA